MDKFIGAILMIMVIAVCYYVIANLDKLNDITIPVSEKIVEYFKVQPFNPSSDIATTTPQL